MSATVKPLSIIVKHLCPYCGAVLESSGPRIGADMLEDSLVALGRAVVEARMVHAIFDCKAVAEW